MNQIPETTDPPGKYWCQPSCKDVLIDDVSAVMDQMAFEKLAEYSSTYPSGVYPGKMWKAHIHGRWYLRWYGIAPGKPTFCSNNIRELLVVAS